VRVREYDLVARVPALWLMARRRSRPFLMQETVAMVSFDGCYA
jgi:hypothetical protein